jgi:DNA-binding NarL/FixJ family response regulator
LIDNAGRGNWLCPARLNICSTIRQQRRGTLNPMSSELTTREIDVLRLMADGRGNAQIARLLHLTLSTVEKHASSIFRKLAVDHDQPGANPRVVAVLHYLRLTGRLT